MGDPIGRSYSRWTMNSKWTMWSKWKWKGKRIERVMKGLNSSEG